MNRKDADNALCKKLFDNLFLTYEDPGPLLAAVPATIKRRVKMLKHQKRLLPRGSKNRKVGRPVSNGTNRQPDRRFAARMMTGQGWKQEDTRNGLLPPGQMMTPPEEQLLTLRKEMPCLSAK